MQVRKVHPNRTLVELTPEEVEELQKAIGRMGQVFQVTVFPALQKLGEALRSAEPVLREFNRAAEACQRLDPAFSGFTCKCPDGACNCDPEEGGVRRSPFPVPGPGTKEDQDA